MSKLTFIEHGKLFFDSLQDHCPKCKKKSVEMQDYIVPEELVSISGIKKEYCSRCDFEVAWFVIKGRRIHLFPTAADAGKWARRYGKK
jgi:hypothetical protein